MTRSSPDSSRRAAFPPPERHEERFALALELANTLGPIQGSGGDRLRTPEQLLAWLSEQRIRGDRLEDVRGSPPLAALLLREADRLRYDVVRALEAFRARRAVPSDALYGIDRVLAERRVASRLRGEGTRPRLDVEVDVRTPSLAAILSPVALSAAELLTHVDARRVRRCAAADCNAWFVDTSKGGRRRWCSMATCGNRAKAARHRQKQRAG